MREKGCDDSNAKSMMNSDLMIIIMKSVQEFEGNTIGYRLPCKLLLESTRGLYICDRANFRVIF